MKIKSIKKVGVKPVYDIEVDQAHSYVLENGVITHNSGLLYSSDTVILTSKSQVKQGTEVVGYNFNLNVMKGRHSLEKSRIPVEILHNGGISRWSGLLEMAVASGDVVKPSNGWYQPVDPDSGELIGDKVRAKDTNTAEFWEPILEREHFKEWVRNTFSVTAGKLMADNVSLEDQPDSQFVMEE